MKTRRMRTASLDEIVEKSNEYLQDFGRNEKELEEKLQSAIESIKNKVEEIKTSTQAEKPRKNNELAKQILSLVNGTDDFPGLSELPEVPAYGKLYDTLVEEYNKLKKSFTITTDDWAFKQVADIESKINQFNNDQAVTFHKFIEALSDVYGPTYAQGWDGFATAIRNLYSSACDYLKFPDGVDSTMADKLSKLVNDRYKALNNIYVDLVYYRRQFDVIFKGVELPENSDSELKTAYGVLQNIYDKARIQMSNGVNLVGEAYDLFIQLGRNAKVENKSK